MFWRTKLAFLVFVWVLHLTPERVCNKMVKRQLNLCFGFPFDHFLKHYLLCCSKPTWQLEIHLVDW